MKVSTVMNAIPRYTHHHWLADLRAVAEQSFQSQTLPFDGQTPFPANVNLVRNKPGGDINTQKIELQAACLGMERLAWIFGADAEYIGLTLKSSEPEAPYFTPGGDGFTPVLLLANIKGRKSEGLDAQYAYFIDQFTGASITRCAAYANQEVTGAGESGGDTSIQKRRSRMVLTILFSLQDYDTGCSHRDMQVQNVKNIRENTRPGTAGFAKARNTYQSQTKQLSPAKKTIFNHIRTYIEKQKTAGEGFSGNHTGPREAVYSAFRSLLETPSGLSKIWFDAAAFTRGLISPQFGPELLSGVKELPHNRKETNHDR
jgi:hypothetical protein